MPFSESLATRIRAALAGRRDVVEKRMFGGVAFMVRGHMSVGVVGDALMVRLAPDDSASFLSEPHVRPMDFTGRPLKGFLYVDPPGIATAATLRRWVGRATAYAESQPVKAPKGAAGKRAAKRTRARPAAKPVSKRPAPKRTTKRAPKRPAARKPR